MMIVVYEKKNKFSIICRSAAGLVLNYFSMKNRVINPNLIFSEEIISPRERKVIILESTNQNLKGNELFQNQVQFEARMEVRKHITKNIIESRNAKQQ